MYRSGSTFTFNLCNQLHKDYRDQVPKADKTHELWHRQAKDEDLLVYSYRDIRVSTASMMRKRQLTADTFKHFYKDGIVSWLELLVDYDEAVKSSSNKKLILRYEKDILDLETTITKVAAFFNITLQPCKLEEYCNKFDIVKTKSYVDSLKRHDIKTHYHPNHISTDKTDYQDYFDSRIYISSPKIMAWLSKNNY
jgi:hypothetical protein